MICYICFDLFPMSLILIKTLFNFEILKSKRDHYPHSSLGLCINDLGKVPQKSRKGGKITVTFSSFFFPKTTVDLNLFKKHKHFRRNFSITFIIRFRLVLWYSTNSFWAHPIFLKFSTRFFFTILHL